jgi:hypothetical protein
MADPSEQAAERLEKAEFWTEPHSFGEAARTDRMSLRVHVLLVRGELLLRYAGDVQRYFSSGADE